jgi:ParB-like chromosome segregation protein Spo0J
MNEWIANKVEHWSIDKLIPYARNPRTHTPAQIDQIAASIAEFGFTNPILVGSDGMIVAGHGRLEAARKLGLKTVPVIVLDHLTPTQRRALVIADNKLALNAGWDEELLSLELAELQDLDYDLELTGFSHEELNRLLSVETDDVKSYANQEVKEQFIVLVECNGEKEQCELIERLTSEGYKCRALMS